MSCETKVIGRKREAQEDRAEDEPEDFKLEFLTDLDVKALSHHGFGDVIAISFNESSVPQKYKMYEVMLKEDKSGGHDIVGIYDYELDLTDGYADFTIEPHFTLASDDKGFNKAKIRHYAIVCQWEDYRNIYQFDFAIRTNAYD